MTKINLNNIILDRNNPVPMYSQLAFYIYEQARNIDETSQLPAVRELSELADVSIITVVKAYNILLEEGIAYSIPGKGTFIRGKNDDKRHEIMLMEIQKKLKEVVDIVATEPLISKEDVYDMLEELFQ